MRISFNLTTTIEIPDVDKVPSREEVEKEFIDFFADEGLITHGLEITNYRAIADEQEGKV